MQPSAHRANARAALSGNWGVAILVSLVAGLITGGGTGIDINLKMPNFNSSSFSTELPPELSGILGTAMGVFFVIILLLALVIFALNLVLGGVISMGDARYNLNLIDRKEALFNDLFSQFPRFKEAFVMHALSTLYIILWSLLLVVPGIIASYSYSMAPYILLEDPDCTGSEALQRSKAMMDGHKMDLFMLHLSFIGWMLLASLTFSIGNLWLTPYQKAANASFYRELQRSGYADVA